MPSRVEDLFRMRLAQRSGELTDANPELTSFGESLGVGPLGGGGGQPAMPGRPVTGPAGAEVPAGDSLASMSPPGEGSAPGRQTQEMTMRADPQAPGGDMEPATVSSVRGTMGIPVLDALSEMPRKKHRGLVHDRTLGRVLTTGS